MLCMYKMQFILLQVTVLAFCGIQLLSLQNSTISLVQIPLWNTLPSLRVLLSPHLRGREPSTQAATSLCLCEVQNTLTSRCIHFLDVVVPVLR